MNDGAPCSLVSPPPGAADRGRSDHQRRTRDSRLQRHRAPADREGSPSAARRRIGAPAVDLRPPGREAVLSRERKASIDAAHRISVVSVVGPLFPAAHEISPHPIPCRCGSNTAPVESSSSERPATKASRSGPDDLGLGAACATRPPLPRPGQARERPRHPICGRLGNGVHTAPSQELCTTAWMKAMPRTPSSIPGSRLSSTRTCSPARRWRIRVAVSR